MVPLAVLFSAISAFGIGIGLEPSENWQRITTRHAAIVALRALIIAFSLVGSFAIIFVSFYFFVLSNALMVLIVWVLVFAITRIALEIIGMPNVYSGERSRKEMLERESGTATARHSIYGAGSPIARKAASHAAEHAAAPRQAEPEHAPAPEPQEAVIGHTVAKTDGNAKTYEDIFNRVNSFLDDMDKPAK